ncbi:MAG TPA: hypothetical protein VFP50_15315 [Anaeromyxobacteraceae bacterium]|nr:hypothetical protein [Anaeromyxobacteraceae bacterium]
MGNKIGLVPSDDSALIRQQALAAALARPDAAPPSAPAVAPSSALQRMRALAAALRMAPHRDAAVQYGPSGEVMPGAGVAPAVRPAMLPNPKRVPAVQP